MCLDTLPTSKFPHDSEAEDIESNKKEFKMLIEAYQEVMGRKAAAEKKYSESAKLLKRTKKKYRGLIENVERFRQNLPQYMLECQEKKNELKKLPKKLNALKKELEVYEQREKDIRKLYDYAKNLMSKYPVDSLRKHSESQFTTHETNENESLKKRNARVERKQNAKDMKRLDAYLKNTDKKYKCSEDLLKLYMYIDILDQKYDKKKDKAGFKAWLKTDDKEDTVENIPDVQSQTQQVIQSKISKLEKRELLRRRQPFFVCLNKQLKQNRHLKRETNKKIEIITKRLAEVKAKPVHPYAWNRLQTKKLNSLEEYIRKNNMADLMQKLQELLDAIDKEVELINDTRHRLEVLECRRKLLLDQEAREAKEIDEWNKKYDEMVIERETEYCNLLDTLIRRKAQLKQLQEESGRSFSDTFLRDIQK